MFSFWQWLNKNVAAAVGFVCSLFLPQAQVIHSSYLTRLLRVLSGSLIKYSSHFSIGGSIEFVFVSGSAQECELAQT